MWLERTRRRCIPYPHHVRFIWIDSERFVLNIEIWLGSLIPVTWNSPLTNAHGIYINNKHFSRKEITNLSTKRYKLWKGTRQSPNFGSLFHFGCGLSWCFCCWCFRRRRRHCRQCWLVSLSFDLGSKWNVEYALKTPIFVCKN